MIVISRCRTRLWWEGLAYIIPWAPEGEDDLYPGGWWT